MNAGHRKMKIIHDIRYYNYFETLLLDLERENET